MVFAPSIIYAPGDPWMTLLQRLSLLPVMPIAGSGQALYQPIWADDVAACVERVLGEKETNGHRRLELAGPETLSYDGIARTALTPSARQRRLLHVPFPFVRRTLGALEWAAQDSVFATAEEADLMAIPMVSATGTAGAESLGVTPRRIGRRASSRPTMTNGARGPRSCVLLLRAALSGGGRCVRPSASAALAMALAALLADRVVRELAARLLDDRSSS